MILFAALRSVSSGIGIMPLIIGTLVAAAAFGLCIWALASGAVARGGFPMARTLPQFRRRGETQFTAASITNIISNPGDDAYDSESVYPLLFRALPKQIAGIFAIGYLLVVDTHMRFTQPFVGMFDRAGDAVNSIGLSYLTVSSIKILLDAADKGHWRVA